MCVQADPIVYTVTTSGANTTNLLSEATVEIDDNGTVSSASFADVTFAAGSIFRKRGEGFLKSCSGMGTFTGEVRIEEGALIIDDVGQLGPTVEGGSTSTDPRVVVSNGASLVVAADASVAKNAIRFCGGIRIAGTGYNGIGALRSESQARIKYLFSSAVTLDGDATIVNACTLPSEDDAQWGTKNGITVNLNAFTLTLSGRRFWSYAAQFKNPGHVVVSGDGCLQLQNDVKWTEGSAANTLTVETGGVLEFYNGKDETTIVTTPRTLVLEDGAKVRSLRTGSAGTTNVCCWTGPVVLNGRVDVDNGDTNRGLSLHGAISGSGGFDLMRGGLDIVSPGNSFTGGVHANAIATSRPSFGLWSGTALPSPFVATNSLLSLSAPVVYTLPALSFHATAGKTLSVTGGVGGTAASLMKTGPGILALTSPLAVTGGVTLAGGTLRLSSEMSAYSPAPGLIESRMSVASTTEGNTFRDAWFTSGTAMNTNRVVSSPEMANQYYGNDDFTWVRGGCEFVRYKGYIWNRADADVTWTVAIAICPQSMLYIDNANTPLISRTTSNWKSAGLATADITLSPGPHLFDLRMYSQAYDKPGARGEQFTNWSNNFGFVIDFEGRGTTDVANYSIPSNNVGSTCGGDGALFTVDARERDDMTGDDYSRASFPTLAATPGTVLDLNAAGSTFTVQELAGITAVTNGSLHVAKNWTLSNEDIASGIPLTGDARITFAPGWTLSIPDLDTLKRVPQCITLAVSPSGGLTMPATFDRGSSLTRKWHLELSADRTCIVMVRSGICITIK